MKIGLISDTHDNLPLIDRVVKRLNEMGVELVLHAGDYVSGFTIPHFKDVNCRLIGVFGNNDGDRDRLRSKFREFKNFEIRDTFAEIITGDKRTVLLHGSDRELLDSIVGTGGFDYVVHGHTHQAMTCRKGKTLVINPGEVCGYLTGKATFAVLDTEKNEVEMENV